MAKTGIGFLDAILDGALGPDKKEVCKKERIGLVRIFDGDLEYPKHGELVLDDGTNIGTLDTDLDPTNFAPKIRLVVPKEQFGTMEVMCDGNALEITTDEAPDGRYIVKRKVRGFAPTIMDDEQTIELPKFESAKEFVAWVEKQDTDTVEALRQIYYDRWNFDTGNQKDRMYYELLDEEKQGRK